MFSYNDFILPLYNLMKMFIVDHLLPPCFTASEKKVCTSV